MSKKWRWLIFAFAVWLIGALLMWDAVGSRGFFGLMLILWANNLSREVSEIDERREIHER